MRRSRSSSARIGIEILRSSASAVHACDSCACIFAAFRPRGRRTCAELVASWRSCDAAMGVLQRVRCTPVCAARLQANLDILKRCPQGFYPVAKVKTCLGTRRDRDAVTGRVPLHFHTDDPARTRRCDAPLAGVSVRVFDLPDARSGSGANRTCQPLQTTAPPRAAIGHRQHLAIRRPDPSLTIPGTIPGGE